MNENSAKPVTTVKDSQRLGCCDRLDVYLSDHERLWKTVNDPVVSSVIRKQNRRPPTTAVIPNDPYTPMTAKNRRRHPVTGKDNMETRLKVAEREIQSSCV